MRTLLGFNHTERIKEGNMIHLERNLFVPAIATDTNMKLAHLRPSIGSCCH
jgi:hypothetical protein